MRDSWCPWSIPVHEGHTAWGVTPTIATASRRRSALLRVSQPIAFESPLNVLLHSGSLVSCHSFLSLFLYFSNLSKHGKSLFILQSLNLLVYNRHSEAMDVVTSRIALSASISGLISLIGDTKLQARLWKRSQYVSFPCGSKNSLAVTSCSVWNTIGNWSESRISQTLTCESLMFWRTKVPQYPAHHRSLRESYRGVMRHLDFDHLHRIT
jgi:hypothetical protein